MADSRSPSYRSLVVAVSYNQEMGGRIANSLRNHIRSMGDIVYDVDYLTIIPKSDELEKIFNDPKLYKKVFADAKKTAEKLLENADCLIIPGNAAMVDPRLYGSKQPEDEPFPVFLPRAIAELALSEVAINKGMPILAICGGHQILNVYLGGKLKQRSQKEMEGDLNVYSENIFNPPNSELAKIVFKNKIQTQNQTRATFFGIHKQVVDPEHIGGKARVMGDDLLAIVATAEGGSGNIEAMEAKYGAPIFSLQFHPEVGIAGFYNVVTNCIINQPRTPQEHEFSANIFKAFRQAVETYAHKKEMHKELNESMHPHSPSPSLKK